MIVVDLSLQAYRDLRTTAQAKVARGYNGVVCASLQPETLAHGLIDTLYGPSGRSKASGEPRGVLTVCDGGEQTYRVVRDLARGGLKTFHVDPDAGPTPLSDDPGEIARLLGMPSRETFETVFRLSQADLPSTQMSASGATDTPIDPSQRADAEARLAAIEEVLAQRERVRRLEFDLDGLQKRKFEIEDTLSSGAIDPGQMKAALAAAERMSYFEQLTDDFGDRYEEMLRTEAVRAADLARWEHEREELERLMRAATVDPILRDWRLWVGLVVGGSAVAIGLLLGGAYRYATFANIPALGLTALALWQNLTLREELSVAKRRLELSDRRRERIVARDREQSEQVKQLAESAVLGSLAEIRRVLAERQTARTRLEELQRAERAAETDPELVRLREELVIIEARIAQLEHELTSFTSSASELSAMEAEARTLRVRLGHADASTAATTGPFDALVGASVELLGMERAECAVALTQRATQFASHLSSKRMSRLDIDAEGNANVVINDKQVALGSLPATARDLAYLAARGALLSAIAPARRMPFIVTPLLATAPSWPGLVRAYLSVLAQAGLQVIYAVGSPDACAGATSVVRFEATE